MAADARRYVALDKMSRIQEVYFYLAGTLPLFPIVSFASGMDSSGFFFWPPFFGAIIGFLAGIVAAILNKSFQRTVLWVAYGLLIIGLLSVAWALIDGGPAAELETAIVIPMWLLLIGILPGALSASVPYLLVRLIKKDSDQAAPNKDMQSDLMSR